MNKFGKNIIAVSALLLGLAGLNPAAQAAEEIGLNLGVTLGASMLNTGWSGAPTVSLSSFQYGARAGYMVNHTLEVGVSFTTTPNAPMNGLVQGLNFYPWSIQNTILTADVNYHFPESGLYVGARMGVSFSSLTSTQNTSTASYVNTPNPQTWFAMGVVGGYDIPVIAGLSVGPRFSYIVNVPRLNRGTSTSTTADGKITTNSKWYASIADFQAAVAITYSL